MISKYKLNAINVTSFPISIFQPLTHKDIKTS